MSVFPAVRCPGGVLRAFAAWARGAAAFRLALELALTSARAAFFRDLLLEPLGLLLSVLTGVGLKLILDALSRDQGGWALGWALGWGASIGLMFLLQGSAARARMRLDESVRIALEARVTRVALDSDLGLLESPAFLDRLELLRQHKDRLGRGPGLLVLTVSLLLRFAVTVALLTVMNPLLLLLLLVAWIPAATAVHGARRAAEAERAVASRLRRARSLLEAATGRAGLSELQASGAGAWLEERYLCEVTGAGREIERARLRALALTLLGWTLFGLGFTAAVGWMVARAARGEATVGDVVLVVFLAALTWSQMINAVGAVSEVAALFKATDHLCWLEKQRRAGKPSGCGAPRRLRRGIRLQDVHFRYPGQEREVLAGLNLCLPAGSVVALVGENGAGKSTLAWLLLGLYQPTSGRVLADDVALLEMREGDWQSRCSVVLQDAARWELTLGEAVGVGHLRRLKEAGRLRAALASAGAAQLEAKHPQGLRQQLGRAWGGWEPSGGQWQKLALARGAMRDRPLLYVFDEPASALDLEAEALLNRRLVARARRCAREGAVTVLVTHRLCGASGADLIVLLHAGRAVEIGSHARLLAQGGRYAELFRLQRRAHGLEEQRDLETAEAEAK
ncbi:ATP-binding cassette subfamily B protein [Deinobacterium chartae]|uniref:ATP-binding cassette subfamily B protein n=1 Tax=Deinobacterium chartae TaxID=521158 RepID=A0A841I075_9DEIO|nr:ATP-binding cassette domain-containing protein [Deinobacterium chartae]MBB6098593.1 ATP-binding cassette subfamily B protein [Deinobacterium chartae]